jgi:hypothetical protein
MLPFESVAMWWPGPSWPPDEVELPADAHEQDRRQQRSAASNIDSHEAPFWNNLKILIMIGRQPGLDTQCFRLSPDIRRSSPWRKSG